MSKYCMIEIAFNNKEEINETINVLLSKRLVASTHIIESNSSWNWKNERESDKEFLLQVKTKVTKQNDIYNEIKKLNLDFLIFKGYFIIKIICRTSLIY